MLKGEVPRPVFIAIIAVVVVLAVFVLFKATQPRTTLTEQQIEDRHGNQNKRIKMLRPNPEQAAPTPGQPDATPAPAPATDR